MFCGETGIRTLEALTALTHFPGVLLQPLGHLSMTFNIYLSLATKVIILWFQYKFKGFLLFIYGKYGLFMKSI